MSSIRADSTKPLAANVKQPPPSTRRLTAITCHSNRRPPQPLSPDRRDGRKSLELPRKSSILLVTVHMYIFRSTHTEPDVRHPSTMRTLFDLRPELTPPLSSGPHNRHFTTNIVELQQAKLNLFSDKGLRPPDPKLLCPPLTMTAFRKSPVSMQSMKSMEQAK